MKYVIACDIDEFGTKETVFIKVDGEHVFDHTNRLSAATRFDDDVEQVLRSLNSHNVEEWYYLRSVNE